MDKIPDWSDKSRSRQRVVLGTNRKVRTEMPVIAVTKPDGITEVPFSYDGDFLTILCDGDAEFFLYYDSTYGVFNPETKVIRLDEES